MRTAQIGLSLQCRADTVPHSNDLGIEQPQRVQLLPNLIERIVASHAAVAGTHRVCRSLRETRSVERRQVFDKYL